MASFSPSVEEISIHSIFSTVSDHRVSDISGLSDPSRIGFLAFNVAMEGVNSSSTKVRISEYFSICRNSSRRKRLTGSYAIPAMECLCTKRERRNPPERDSDDWQGSVAETKILG